MAKIIYYDEEAREKLLNGINAVANAVKITLGPVGLNVAIGKPFGGAPNIINDGVSIAKEVVLKDPVENMGAEIAKSIGSIADKCGDGTTTSTLIAQQLSKIGFEKIKKGANAILMRDGINAAIKDVIEYLKNLAVEADDEKLKQVAYVSCGCNKELGNLIADALKKAGKDSTINITDGRSFEDKVVQNEGLCVEKGYISPYLVTDPERMECVLENPIVLVVNKKINLIADIIPTLNFCAANQKPLLLIAEDVEGDALSSIVINSIRKIVSVGCLKAPGFGETKKANLEDICALTNGTLWTEELGLKLETLDPQTTPEYFGKATTVKITRDDTTIVVKDKSPKLDSHIASLRTQLEQAESDYDREKLTERIAKLTGGVVSIEVGGVDEITQKEKSLRLTDAVNSVKSATNGILAGGGASLLQAQKHFEVIADEYSNKDFRAGYDSVIQALSLPTWQIAENSGKNGDEVVAKCKETGLGYNALTDSYEDLIETGIIDTFSIVTNSLKSAASVVGTLLTTRVTIVEEPQENNNQSFQPSGSPMMM